MTDQDGPLIGGRYRLLERLGHGGMGTIWRAVDETVRRDVAVKEPRLPENLTPDQRTRFFERMLREARAAAGVANPHVVTLHDVVIHDGRPWLVMELVRGRSLADVLDEGTLSPREAARIGAAVAEALRAVHANGVLHRDIKPGNVLLADDGRVILTDFGIAQVEGEAPMTETGAVAGSPEYVAPERVNGLRPGPPSDLWSLGVLLYQSVEGWSPFRRSNSMTTMLAVRDEIPPPPARAGELAPLVTALLQKDPAARPEVGAVLAGLKHVAEPPPAPQLTPPPGVAPPVGPGGTRLDTGGPVPFAAPPQAWHRRPRNRLIGAGLALLVIAGAALAVADPWAGPSGVPSTWVTNDEAAVKMTIPTPSGYSRSNSSSYSTPGVLWTSPKAEDRKTGLGIVVGSAYQDSTNDKSAGAAADSGVGNYSTTAYSNPILERENYTIDYQVPFKGRKASVLDLTYCANKKDKAAGKLSRVINFYVLDKSGKAEYQVWVSFYGDAKQVGGEAPRAIYDKVVAGLKIPGLDA
ncbi:hypothetical protein BIV57_01865 [Mangrovactinospora gilvigrisea]|uniref:non-specific serine/threonine protein kinase n=1 Tax=Mangrovactinospora gilvigrisea TaxID=1428644 RepID=A0A1J7CCJ9_9ACTN|nr:serine/threonine-protein kinase [Mangrovactinospora gilvigrisea]OIV39256.1 hypothetical protein BIV57_01865 [Mangrovactinospora gilvigrisea]